MLMRGCYKILLSLAANVRFSDFQYSRALARQKGFSMVELSISLSILALLATGALSILNTQNQGTRVRDTMTKLAVIEEALKLFVDKNGYLPCPGIGTSLETATTFGVASAYTTSTGLCAEDPGMLPLRSIGLPATYAYDAWGRKFTYRLATGMGRAQDFRDPRYDGDLAVTDLAGREKTTALVGDRKYRQGAAYVIISYGPDGNGAWFRNNASTPTATAGRELENTNHTTNRIYIQDNGNSMFNDIVAYKRKNDLSPPRKAEAPFLIDDLVCHNAQSIIKDGIPTAGTNDLGNFANANAAYPAIANQAFETAKYLYTFCQAREKPFIPTDINGNVLWLDATDIDGNGDTSDNPANTSLITQWVSKSPNVLRMKRDSNTLAAVPTLTTGGINGRDVVTVNGAAGHVLAITSSPFLDHSGSYSIFAVVKITTPVAIGHILLKSDYPLQVQYQLGEHDLVTTNGKMYGYHGGNGGGGTKSISNDALIVANVPTIIGQTNSWDGTTNSTMTFYKNGASWGGGTGAGQSYNAADDLYLGYFFRGQIGEILIYNRLLSTPEQKKVEGYLSSKWGITVQ
ncbi:MAG: type secretion system protein [Rickettsiales bacterium]|jgi:prepilin-type N-terminal cleavage/methylation domain-containing protein|nr:type secretion system protein [Rickettsiales bacterium]